MKHDWKYIKLGDIISPAKVVRNGANKKFPVLSITMRDGIVLQSSRFKKSIASVDTSDYKVVYNGQLVIAFPIDEGLIYTQDIVDAGIMSPAYNVWNVDFLEIDRKFLVLYLHCPFSMAYYKSKLRGTTMRRRSMPKEDLLNMPLPVPSFSVQQSIVSELDKINELIRLKKEQLKDYDNLAQSIFYEMFGDPVVNEKGWEVKKLGELSDLICNGNTPKGGSEVYVDTGFLFLRSQNVWKNRIELDDVAFIDEATHKSLKKSSLKHNDLLITKTGRINTENSSLGRTALFEGEDNSANINGHVYLVRLKDGMVHKFVLYILISNSYRELIRKTCVGGIDKRQLNKDHIEDFPIIFPPIELQKKYVERIELIEKQKDQVRSTIQALETLLASRMQYWFG